MMNDELIPYLFNNGVLLLVLGLLVAAACYQKVEGKGYIVERLLLSSLAIASSMVVINIIIEFSPN